MTRSLIAAFALLACGCSQAEAGPATPGNLRQALARAKPGETVVLAPGDYGAVTLPRGDFDPPVKIDARQARFTGLTLNKVAGVTIEGGTIVGPGGKSYGISIRDARDIRISGMTIGGAHRGIVVNQSQDVALVGNRLAGLISDGINVAHSHRVLIERNSCRDFSPTPAVYDARGKLVRDGDHADCIQAWSRPPFAPTSDLTIVGNEVDGLMQGVFLGNHVRNGVDDGGFDRIVIRDNRIRIGVPNGIYVKGGRGGEITGNDVRAIPGAMMPNRPIPVKAKIVVEATGMRFCGNRVPNVPNNPGTARC